MVISTLSFEIACIWKTKTNWMALFSFTSTYYSNFFFFCEKKNRRIDFKIRVIKCLKIARQIKSSKVGKLLASTSSFQLTQLLSCWLLNFPLILLNVGFSPNLTIFRFFGVSPAHLKTLFYLMEKRLKCYLLSLLRFIKNYLRMRTNNQNYQFNCSLYIYFTAFQWKWNSADTCKKCQRIWIWKHQVDVIFNFGGNRLRIRKL